MTNILVTGGAGFIGSHTCLALLERGYDIVIIDSFINSKPISIDRILEISDLNKSQNRINVVQADLRPAKWITPRMGLPCCLASLNILFNFSIFLRSN